MPIYEYRCQACGHELDALQKLSEAPLKTCPACEQDELVRLISAAGFRLKGSGWYETDFKDKNKRNIAGDGEKSGKPDKTESASSDKPGKSSDDAASGKSKPPKESGD